MIILVTDSNMITHGELVRCVSEAWPGEPIQRFTDPLLCLKYGINYPADLLITAVQMRGATGQDITRILRRYSPNLWVVYVTDGSVSCNVGFEIVPNSVVQRPVTAEKLRRSVDASVLDRHKG